jgi:osmotically-inducible protein OsmY
MAKRIMTKYRSKMPMLTAAFCVLTGSTVFAGQVPADRGVTSSNSASRQDDAMQTSASHHYLSAAERAKDDLLITEVKRDLADDGIADDYPVAVDCDHGKIRLSGVIGSADDARRAGELAAGAPGVVAVENQLTWRK